MSDGKKFSHRYDKAILALLSEPTLDLAAKKAGIGAATLQRWLHNPSFQAGYRVARRQAFEAGLSRLQALTGQAVQTLETIMSDPLAKGSAKVAAARCVLESAMKIMGVEEDDDSTPPPTAAPTFDLSKLTDEEWALYKTLRLKCTQYSNNTPHPLTQKGDL